MGVRFDEEKNCFVLDFEHDGQHDIIRLTGSGYEVTAFNRCFYYGYEFEEDVDGHVRSAFIKYLKFSDNLKDNPDLTLFIRKAVDDLSNKINLYDYDLVIMPESSSKVNSYMLRYIYRFAQPMLRPIEVVKSLPENISFDMDAYEQTYLDAKLENGRPRYTEAQKQQVKDSIQKMMDLIHKKSYFTIAKDVKKNKMRPFVTDFLKFANEQDELLCRTIRRQNILVIDDIATSGSTINELLRALRILNEDNKITIFSLIGRQDLTVDAIE